MSSFALLLLLAAGVLAFIFVKTLQKDGMKIASDPKNENNMLQAKNAEIEDAFTKTMRRADNAFEEGAYFDAESALETALRMQPENEIVLGKLAYVLEKQEDYKAAAAIYDKALETHKNSVSLLASYARMSYSQGDKDKAKELYIKAVGLEPYEPTIYYDFSNLLLEFGEKDAAKQGFERALELDRKFQPAIDALAKL
ncbi:MAG: tetratricopeptide repeat protein [Thiovulaceae bacterium]|nr:tetratricopeptide repeat protein [Sulfurimonadaceae bacterium]